jgi:mannose-6-phosphate isomerase-like protein (cupin superfamily)
MGRLTSLSKVAEIIYTENRPWGSFSVLEEGSNFKVKRLVVNPGQRFSLQYHQHRSEHWVIVAGRGFVTINEEIRMVVANDAILIPSGAVHRLENAGDLPLVVIEVQYGSYLGEDDIVRLADDYCR